MLPDQTSTLQDIEHAFVSLMIFAGCFAAAVLLGIATVIATLRGAEALSEWRRCRTRGWQRRDLIGRAIRAVAFWVIAKVDASEDRRIRARARKAQQEVDALFAIPVQAGETWPSWPKHEETA